MHSVLFYPDKNAGSGQVDMIRETIINIIFYFLAENECPILFICDSNEIEALARCRLFQSWHRYYKDDREFS